MNKITLNEFNTMLLAKQNFSNVKNDFYSYFLNLLPVNDELYNLSFSGLHSIGNIYHIIITEEGYEGENFFDFSDINKDSLRKLKEKENIYRETLLNKINFDKFIKSTISDKFNKQLLDSCSISNVNLKDNCNELTFILKSSFYMETEEGEKIKTNRFRSEYKINLNEYIEKHELKV